MLLLLFQAFLTLNSGAQVEYDSCNASSGQAWDFEVKLMGKAFVNKYPGRNILFYKSWMPGELQMSDGAIVKNKILVYNCLLDELIWMRARDNEQVVLNKKTIAGFTLYDPDHQKIAEFKKITLKDKFAADSSDTYIQVLVKGRLTLYVERKVIFLENTNEFQSRDQYFLLKDGGLYDLVPNRWSLFRLMGEDGAKMKTIVRQNSLFVHQEPQLIRAVQLFNKEDN